MVIEQPPQRPTEGRSPAQRRWVVAGAVVAAYAGFAGFAQVIGEDRPDRSDLAALDGFCTVLYSDQYPSVLDGLAFSGGGLGGAGNLPPFFTQFIDPDLAP